MKIELNDGGTIITTNAKVEELVFIGGPGSLNARLADWWHHILHDANREEWFGRRIPTSRVHEHIRYYLDDGDLSCNVLTNRVYNLTRAKAVKTRVGQPTGVKVRAMQFYDRDSHLKHFAQWIRWNSTYVKKDD